MAEGVFHRAVAVAPELVGERHFHRAAGFHRALECGVGVLDVKVERGAGAAAGSGAPVSGPARWDLEWPRRVGGRRSGGTVQLRPSGLSAFRKLLEYSANPFDQGIDPGG